MMTFQLCFIIDHITISTNIPRRLFVVLSPRVINVSSVCVDRLSCKFLLISKTEIINLAYRKHIKLPLLWTSQQKSTIKPEMGQTMSTGDVVRLGEEVLREFASRSMWGKLASASSATNSCTSPDGHDWPKLRHYTECMFMRSQRDAWELVFILGLLLFVALIILLFFVMGSLKRVAIRATKHVVSVVTQVNVASGERNKQKSDARNSSTDNRSELQPSREAYRSGQDSWV